MAHDQYGQGFGLLLRKQARETVLLQHWMQTQRIPTVRDPLPGVGAVENHLASPCPWHHRQEAEDVDRYLREVAAAAVDDRQRPQLLVPGLVIEYPRHAPGLEDLAGEQLICHAADRPKCLHPFESSAAEQESE